MYKIQGLIGIVFILAIVLCACGKIKKPVQQPENLLPEGEPMEITCFSFTHTGMSTEECFQYSVEQTKDGVRLYTEELFSGGFIVDTIIEEPVLEQLGEIAGRYRMDSWNGFDKSDKRVMDGSNFSLSILLADGESISARGSNCFPEGYGGAEEEICTLFEDLIDRCGNRYPKTLESEDLIYISLTIRRKTDQGDEAFELEVYAPPEGSVDMDVWFKGYKEFWPEGEYRFGGYCESFPFAEFQKLVRQYDVPSWNGWDEVVDGVNTEWLQMTLGYASGEEIKVEGSLFPEHYDAFRDACLKTTVTFVQENKDTFTQ